MEFTNTKELLYKRCIERISDRKTEMNLLQSDIYPDNPKMISRILNNRIDKKRNPYLIPFSALCAIRDNLRFDSEQEVLWGTHDDIENDSPNIFEALIMDLYSSTEHKKLIVNILCGYIPYARYYSYDSWLSKIKDSENAEYDLLRKNYNDLFDEIDINGLRNTSEAILSKYIYYLFCQCHTSFIESYLYYTDNKSSYKKLDNELSNWISTVFIKIISNYIPNQYSYGTHVRNTYNAFFHCLSTMNITYDNVTVASDSLIKLLEETERHVNRIEEIQSSLFDQEMCFGVATF